MSLTLTYQKYWNATSNTPTLADGTGTLGYTYVVLVGGTRNLGSGSVTYTAGQLIYYDGSIYRKVNNFDDLSAIGDFVTSSTPTGMTNPMTSVGDIIYSSSSSGTPTRLGIGGAGQVLTVSGGIPAWTTIGGTGTVTSIATTSPILGGTITTSGTISIQQSTTSQDGYLSSIDWNTFNSKGSGTVTSIGLTSSDITVGGSSPITTSGTFTLTLPTVNSNVGTFNNVTVTGKGLVTAASNVAYLTTISGIAAGGDLTGTYTSPTIASNAVTYAKMQAISSTSRLLGSSTTTTPVQELLIGSGLTLSGSVLISTGTGGTVTSVSGTSNRITSTGGTIPVIDISAAYVGQTSLTTLGTITTGVWNGTMLTPTYGGTGLATLTAHNLLVGNGTSNVSFVAPGATANKVLLSNGTDFVLSTPTFPNASATTRKIIVSDGTNWIASTETYATPGTSGNVLTSDGTNWVSSAPATGGTVTSIATSGGITGGTITTTGTISLASIAANSVLANTSGSSGTPSSALSYSSANNVSNLPLRDANGDLNTNYFAPKVAVTVSAIGTTTLVSTSGHYHILTGFSNQTYQLPDATTIPARSWYEFNNNSTGIITITNNSGSTLYTLAAGTLARISMLTSGSGDGTWDKHTLAPDNCTWSTSGLVVTGTFQATGHVTLESVTSTGATGTGNLVFATSPTFVTPALGTPASGTLTNCTFPTLNQNSTGSAASLSVTGQTGLFTVVGLTSTNRAKTVRDAADTILELGGSYTPTGTWTSLTMVTPVLGTPTSGTLTNCTTSVPAAPATTAVGFLGMPQNSKSAAYTTVMSDAGGHLYHPGADTTARTWTIDSNANVAYPIGTTLTFINDTSGGVITIAITSDTMILAGAGTTGSRTLAANGMATAVKMTSTRWMINGVGLT